MPLARVRPTASPDAVPMLPGRVTVLLARFACRTDARASATPDGAVERCGGLTYAFQQEAEQAGHHRVRVLRLAGMPEALRSTAHPAYAGEDPARLTHYLAWLDGRWAVDWTWAQFDRPAVGRHPRVRTLPEPAALVSGAAGWRVVEEEVGRVALDDPPAAPGCYVRGHEWFPAG